MGCKLKLKLNIYTTTVVNIFFFFFWPFQAYFSNLLFDRFPSKLSLTTNHLLENVA